MSGDFDKVASLQRLANLHEQSVKECHQAENRAIKQGNTSLAEDLRSHAAFNQQLSDKYSNQARLEMAREELENEW